MNRTRAAVLAAVMLQPSTRLHCELRSRSIDEVWDMFVQHDPLVSASLLTRFAAIDADALLRTTERSGARIVIPGDDEWPIQLDDLGNTRPWALWFRGHALPSERSVAIVGSRSCTSYGERIAAEFAHGIGDAGYPIVSGGAFGIDAAAHRGALAADAHTVAVLACGVDVAYPAAHAALFERIAECGTLISESPPGAHPTRPAFLIRNRLIAALAYGTVVVEARYRSGALSTSRHAAELNRIVMGIPGPITSPESSGVHALIKSGAELVTSADDVLSLIAPLGSVTGEVITDTEREWDALSPAEQLVYEALPRRQAVGVDSIFTSLTTDLSLPAILGALVGLAQRGLVAEGLDGSWTRTRTLRGAGA